MTKHNFFLDRQLVVFLVSCSIEAKRILSFRQNSKVCGRRRTCGDGDPFPRSRRRNTRNCLFLPKVSRTRHLRRYSGCPTGQHEKKKRSIRSLLWIWHIVYFFPQISMLNFCPFQMARNRDCALLLSHLYRVLCNRVVPYTVQRTAVQAMFFGWWSSPTTRFPSRSSLIGWYLLHLSVLLHWWKKKNKRSIFKARIFPPSGRSSYCWRRYAWWWGGNLFCWITFNTRRWSTSLVSDHFLVKLSQTKLKTILVNEKGRPEWFHCDYDVHFKSNIPQLVGLSMGYNQYPHPYGRT